MKFTDGLFLKTGREVAKEYAGRVLFTIVDNMHAAGTKAPQL